MTKSVHISERIDRNVAEVHIYAAKPENLQNWMTDVTSDMEIRFAKPNYFGIVDVWRTRAGRTQYIPIRVLEDGRTSEVVLTVRGDPDVDEADVATLAGALAKLKAILEA
jgi:hypothetical protein